MDLTLKAMEVERMRQTVTENNDRIEKLETLKTVLGGYQKAAVAFSGGVDSTFLLGVAREVLGERVIAVTAIASFISSREVGEARDFAASLGVRHEIIEVDLGDISLFEENPPDRCYHCKKALFSRILAVAEGLECEVVMDASNTDDTKDYRPGMKALYELEIKSPLREAGFAKSDVRAVSKELGFPGYDRPAAACLASRIPFGEDITEAKLQRVELAEAVLASEGFRVNRVRVHGDLARIEVAPEKLDDLADYAMRARISERLRDLGFRYITVDIEGYRMGSLNESLDI
ncbi:MAG: ATP-dependent sacrificial sulfur transferase LarE [Bacteroidales bacterium]|nr:ATP-dependent sacrificial sulfur transferase LarE [Candidatus Latescibacterota bacterium]